MTENEMDWTQFAKKIRTAAADGDDADLAFFAEELKDVQILALGESTHGTREIFQMKHRMISYLIENHDFKLVTIEAGVEPCRHIDEYVRHGRGELGRALSKQSYWTWDTLEVTHMLEWMREYNLSCVPGEECGFVGFDMKPIEGACDNLRALVLGLDLPQKEKALQVISDCRDLAWYQPEPQEIPDVFWLNGWLASLRHDLSQHINEETYRLAQEDARYMSQFVLSVKRLQEGETSWAGIRDDFMARNVKRLADENPGQKLIVWAHNGHVANDGVNKSMGWHLKQYYGSRYYTIGFLMGVGGFQSRDSRTLELRSFSIKEPFPGTWDETFYQSFGKKNWYLPTRTSAAASPAFNDWVNQEKPSFLIGAMYAHEGDEEEFFKGSEVKSALGEMYDGVFYLGQVMRARPNLSGQR